MVAYSILKRTMGFQTFGCASKALLFRLYSFILHYEHLGVLDYLYFSSSLKFKQYLSLIILCDSDMCAAIIA